MIEGSWLCLVSGFAQFKAFRTVVLKWGASLSPGGVKKFLGGRELFLALQQGFPTFFLPCTPSAFRQMSMYLYSISTDKDVPLQTFDR